MNINLNFLLIELLALPLLGTLLVFINSKSSEKVISYSAMIVSGFHLLITMCLLVLWAAQDFNAVNVKEFVIYQKSGYEFFIDLYFDRVSATFMFVGSLLTFLITVYSSFYMHNEKGYRRFFGNILIFFFGYNVIILAGNFETLFLGWEILGVSSFLLIAYYRERFLPVKNAVKVFSIYRLGDVGLILAMWLSHHFWHENITFAKLADINLVHSQIIHHETLALSISLVILLTAIIKSAQFPFSSWLPRAMEGPTPSSAIFYGSLAVHIGAFLLMRTSHFWHDLVLFKVLLILVGITSLATSTLTARVQSSIKAQIAYSSIAQIGIIFIEIALGLEMLALVHFAGNAFLRTYQLLISPSLVTYKIKDQFFHFEAKNHYISKRSKTWKYTLYMLSLKEWNLDDILFRYLWMPMKHVGKKFGFLTISNLLFVFIPAFLIAIVALYFKASIPGEIAQYLPELMALLGLVLVIKSFTERRSVRLAFLLVILNHFWVALAISFNDEINMEHLLIYLSGVVAFGIIGYAAILRLKKLERKVFLNQFYGHAYHHPKIALVFLIACLGIAGFPISPTFIGEDLVFSHIQSQQLFLAVFASLSFILDGLSLIRIYARVFLGPHHKADHERALRSS